MGFCASSCIDYKMNKPKALKRGDTIGFIAPAGPPNIERVNRVEEFFDAWGFKTKIGKTAYEKYGYLAGKDEVRANDFNSMFADDSVDGVICLRGGYGTNKILHMLDYDMIKSNPKVFVGYSDITAIHTAIHNNCDLVTFHGPMAETDIVTGIDDFSKNCLLKAITDAEPVGLMKNPKGAEIKSLYGGACEGEIVGGNLALVASNIGTPFEINTKGRILFLEDIDEAPYRIDRMLTQLLQSGKLQDAAGIVMGDWNNCIPSTNSSSLDLMQVFNDILLPLQKPIIYNLKAGHCEPNITIPLGAKAYLDADKCELVIKENAVI